MSTVDAVLAGIVVDFSRYFRGIFDVGSDTVRVQPGVVQGDLKRTLAKVGRRFAPEAATDESTLGGMIATNASCACAVTDGTSAGGIGGGG